jgi:predicted dehydrogenase
MQKTPKQMNVALIGAGIFARDAHLPAWAKLRDRAHIAAVWSRTRANAEALAATLPGPVQVADDLAALLANPEIDAVDIVLPIDAQAAIIEQALAAGKHVVSEKPIAATSAQAQDLIALWERTDRVWMVAENWRYERAFQHAAALVHDGAIGAPVTVSWGLHLPVDPANKYYHTAWRRSGQFQGGFLLDGGVHHVAAMRAILGDVAAVRAEVRQFSPELPPADTISATLHFVGGAIGSYLVSYAVRSAWEEPLHIVGTDGSLRVTVAGLDVAQIGGQLVRHEAPPRDGVDVELEAFVAAVLDGAPHLDTPSEALRDLAVIEAMLKSAQSGHMEYVAQVA